MTPEAEKRIADIAFGAVGYRSGRILERECIHNAIVKAMSDELLTAEIRNRAIEECAKVCEVIGDDWKENDDFLKHHATMYLAVQIRALKSK
jgi:hypothetical protein